MQGQHRLEALYFEMPECIAMDEIVPKFGKCNHSQERQIQFEGPPGQSVSHPRPRSLGLESRLRLRASACQWASQLQDPPGVLHLFLCRATACEKCGFGWRHVEEAANKELQEPRFAAAYENESHKLQ